MSSMLMVLLSNINMPWNEILISISSQKTSESGVLSILVDTINRLKNAFEKYVVSWMYSISYRVLRFEPVVLWFKIYTKHITPGPLVTKRQHVLPPNLVKSRSHKIRGGGGGGIMILSLWTWHASRQHCCKRKSPNPNLAASRLHEILWEDMLSE